LEISDGEEVVEIQMFIRKAGTTLKLPKQSLGNPKDAFEWYFDLNLIGIANFALFAAFLAMFGPPQTAIRKLGHFLECPRELLEKLIFLDAALCRRTGIQSDRHDRERIQFIPSWKTRVQ
jgi:hypothetical protein